MLMRVCVCAGRSSGGQHPLSDTWKRRLACRTPNSAFYFGFYYIPSTKFLRHPSLLCVQFAVHLARHLVGAYGDFIASHSLFFPGSLLMLCVVLHTLDCLRTIVCVCLPYICIHLGGVGWETKKEKGG
jgi:hypothetical protein